jgi:hypothetical protein
MQSLSNQSTGYKCRMVNISALKIRLYVDRLNSCAQSTCLQPGSMPSLLGAERMHVPIILNPTEVHRFQLFHCHTFITTVNCSSLNVELNIYESTIVCINIYIEVINYIRKLQTYYNTLFQKYRL